MPKPWPLNVLLAAACLLLALPATAEPTAAPPQAAPGAEILWDQWGVPHIFASDDEQLFYAEGWAQAKNHADLLLRLYGQARARGAEYWGESYLDQDRWLATMGVPERAAQWLAAQSPTTRHSLEAFADGINAYCRAHPEAVADEVERVLPVAADDVLAHVQQAIHFTFLINRGAVAAAGRQLGEAGSNAWAIGPQRSASGKALLVANPHLPWSGLFTWFEAQLTAPGLDAYGVTLVGTPFLGIAFNDHVGWTHTVNTLDGADLYTLELAPGGYRFDGAVKAFEVSTRTLQVRQADGSLRAETLTIRRSVQGPVVSEQGDKALALRVAGLDQPAMMEQYMAMARAGSLAELERAEARLQMPMFTLMAADDGGHILHLFGGRVPRRPAGAWNWSASVPGNTAKTLWTETLAYDELPRVLDPPSGWLQNANDPPWTTTFPVALDPDRFPPYVAPRFMHLRAQRSARMLADDPSLTFDEVVTDKLSTHMELADRWLDDLATAVAGSGSPAAERAMAVLAGWDRSADAESRGGVLFEQFANRLLRGGASPYAVEWRADKPLSTPDGFADPKAAVAALEAAAAEVEKRWGRLDVAWGEVHRLRLAGRDLPANGGPGQLGIFRVVNFEPAADGRLTAVGGESYVAVTEFGSPLRARALLSYGNASQPGSAHRGDQLELFARKELRPVWRTRAEIAAHLEAHEALRRPAAAGGS